MGIDTGIGWCDATWNPWRGCRPVSAGCEHCYMFLGQRAKGLDPSAILRSKTTFEDPWKWSKSKRLAYGRKVFVCSWSDFFLEEADPWREDAWRIMALAPQYTYLLLTKRPERIAQCLPASWDPAGDDRNKWIGVTAECQATADARIPLLLDTPAAVRFVSCEPLLGPVSLGLWLCDHASCEDWGLCRGRLRTQCGSRGRGMDWIIAGGETGTGARPMAAAWIRELRDQATSAGVPFFFKHWGEWVPRREAHAMGLVGSEVRHPWGLCQPDMERVGRWRAGNVLDGRQWEESPEMS